MEGRFYNFYLRTGLRNKGASYPDVLRRLADYLEQDQYNVVHPLHKTPEEKRLAVLKKRASKLKTMTANKKDILDEIQTLSEIIKQDKSRRVKYNPDKQSLVTKDKESPWSKRIEVNNQQPTESSTT
jgi:hypothetical protein